MRERPPPIRAPGREDERPRERAETRDSGGLLALQQTAGNQAVTQLLARQAGAAPAKRKGRDVGAMSDQDLQREHDRVSGEMVRGNPSDARWRQLFTRSTELSEELERREKAAEDRAVGEAARDRASLLVGEAARTSNDLRQEITYAVETLDDVADRLNAYLGYYNEAYDRFTAVLAKAKRDAAARQQRNEAILGVVVGTGLGLTAAAIFHGAKGVFKVITEAGAEATELVLGKAGGGGPGDAFTPPASLAPQLRSGPAGERLLDAWRGLATFNLTTHAFGQYQLALQKVAFELERDPSPDRVRDLYRLLVRDDLGAFRRAMAALRDNVGAFSAAVRHPLLYKIGYEIEQDLWIRWIAALPNDAEARADALDEDAIEDHLHKIGVLGGDSRLAVDFGMNTTMGDTEAAYKSALREVSELNQIGRYAVAGDAIQPKGRGTVRVRNGLYERLGRKPPPQQGPEATYPAVLWGTDRVGAGQVVRIMGTSSAGVQVQPAHDRDFKPVFI